MNISKEVQKGPRQSRSWNDMPSELIELIISKLSVVDCIRLQATCKVWHSLPISLQEVNVWPWLMYFTGDGKYCKFIDPLYGREYVMEMDWLGLDGQVVPHFSKDGWVLVSTESSPLIVINPFTRSAKKLSCSCSVYGCSVSFSSVPTSPDFRLFRNQFYHIYTTCGMDSWSNGRSAHQPGRPFRGPPSDPFLFRGEYYCLGRTGDLAIYYPDSETWEILDRPAGIHEHDIKAVWYYLMEMEGELISLFHGMEGLQDPIRVFKLDESRTVWSEIKDLGNLMLFLGRESGIIRPSPFEGCANRIYLPRFDDNSKIGGYYCMKTRGCKPKLSNMTQPFHYVWIEPNFSN
jgi:F-box domain